MINYVPGPTGQAFLESRARVKRIMGPIGGGKSTVCLMDLLDRAVTQEPFDNVRRTKFLIVRNTLAQLRATVKPLIDTWFVTMTKGRMGQWRLTDMTFEAKFKMSDGTVVHSEFILMPADTPDDVRRLLSLEVSAAWLEEAREIDPDVADGVQSRTNRFPSRVAGGVTYPGLICSTNPPPRDTYWAEKMEKPEGNAEVFIQPPALRDDGTLNDTDTLDADGNVIMARAENLEHLAPSYYADLVEGKTEDWINVYLKNKFGAGNAGKPLYKDTFRPSFHRSKSELNVTLASSGTIVVGMDNGLQAAAVFGQQDMRGIVNLLGEAYVPAEKTMGVERFLDTILLPYCNTRFPGVARGKFMFILDPACFQRSQVNEATIAGAVRARGFLAVPAPTNDPTLRMTAVEGLLTRTIDGQPGFRVDPRATHVLATLEYGHQFKKTATGLSTMEAAKNHFSHTGDAVQYLCLYFNNTAAFKLNTTNKKARPIKRSTYMYS